nr:hypothetical protein [Tanacetum cinerariifolium]
WPPSNLYDRFVPSGGYHAVPPLVTGTFMPPKPDLVFHTPPSDENEHLFFNYALVNHSISPLHKVTTTAPPQSQLVLTTAARSALTPTTIFKPSNSPPRVTAAKASAGNPQQALRDKWVINSGCLRHMTGNMSYLSDFEELNGAYFAFGGNPKGGKITGK